MFKDIGCYIAILCVGLWITGMLLVIAVDVKDNHDTFGKTFTIIDSSGTQHRDLKLKSGSVYIRENGKTIEFTGSIVRLEQ